MGWEAGQITLGHGLMYRFKYNCVSPFSADILVNCVIGFFCAHSPLRSAVTSLLFPVLSLVGRCVFSKWQDTFFIVTVRMLSIYLVTL